MNKKNITLSLKNFFPFCIPLLLCIIISIFSVSTAFAVKTKPAKYQDPFIEMRKQIADFEQFIEEKEEKKECYYDRGKDLLVFYNLQNTPYASLRADQEVIKGSKTYNKNINEVDDLIYKAVLQFSINEHACIDNSFAIARNKLSSIFEYRSTLLQKTQAYNTALNIFKKENDNTDPGFFTFTETTLIFKNLMKKIDLISKAATDLKDGEISSEYDFRLTEAERNKIRQRGRERANAYADDFIEAAQAYVYSPILRSSTDIKKELESLPDGRSEFDNYTYSVDFKKILSNMLSPEAKKNSTDIVNKNTEYNDTFRTVFNENSIYITNKTKSDNAKYVKNLEDMMRLEETIANSNKPFSRAVVESLVPFHVTLLETETLLNYNTKNLKYVLNRQNVEVE